MHLTFQVPEAILHQLLDPVALPSMARIAYALPTPSPVRDIEGAVREQMQRPEISVSIRRGQRVAIGVGSRGIARLPVVVSVVVSELRRLGAEPFIVPAMGSHGGATADGQRDMLLSLGVTPERVGAEIVSQMETIEIGRAADGTPVRMDRLAAEADGIVFIARVKPHTAFRGVYESGLAKMVAIGLGKQEGAATCHARGFSHMARMIPLLAEVALAQAPVRFGIAIIENAREQPSKIVAVPGPNILREEPALLEEAKAAMPRIPFSQLDVLIMDEIGKDISGDGADPNITGRYPTPDANGGPSVTKQVILDLTEASGGNANGIGTADFTTIRAARKMDLGNTYPNGLTSTVVGPVRLPMVLPSDRLALQAAVLTCNAVGRDARVMRIRNTLQLEEFWVSEGLLEDARQDPALELLTDARPLTFDASGNLCADD